VEFVIEPAGWYGRRLLNVEVSESDLLEWEFQSHDALFLFSVNYISFLQNDHYSLDVRQRALGNYYETILSNAYAQHPFTATQRIFNLIIYMHSCTGADEWVDELYSDLNFLYGNLEFDLSANHLLDNLMALYSGSMLLGWSKGLTKARNYLFRELDKQILSDGAHYELSPMYHNLLLKHLIDTLNISKGYGKVDDDQSILCRVILSMLNWSNQMSMTEKPFPLFHDSSYGMALDHKALKEYFETVMPSTDMNSKAVVPIETFHVIRMTNYSAWLDLGMLGPPFQPGHSHAQSLTFELEVNGRPFIVEKGVSTYHNVEQRLNERASRSHNTVVIDDGNSSEIWLKFRMGRRARSKIISRQEGRLNLECQHYKGPIHKRSWTCNDDQIIIVDEVNVKNPGSAKAYFHFDPKVALSLDNNIVSSDLAQITFAGASTIALNKYQYAKGFNDTSTSTMIEIVFENQLRTEISFNEK
jgi:hypothetical protein